jgi:hypothetical protein
VILPSILEARGLTVQSRGAWEGGGLREDARHVVVRRGGGSSDGWLVWSVGPLGLGDVSLVHHPR